MSDSPAAPEAKTADAPVAGGKFQQVMDKIYADLRGEIIEQDFDIGDAARLGDHAMNLLSSYRDVPGDVKKKMVITIVNRLIGDIPMDENLRAVLLVGTSQLLPKLVEIIYRAWMKKFDIDGDGKISAEEYKKVCCARCLPPAEK